MEENMTENQIAIRVQQEIEKFLSNPINVIKAYERALSQANIQIADMQPKVEMYELVMGSESLLEMSAAAKALNFRGMGRNNLFEYLKERKILRYNNEPYQQYVDAKCFKIIEQPFHINGETVINRKTMVTAKGVSYIGKLLLEDGYAVNER